MLRLITTFIKEYIYLFQRGIYEGLKVEAEDQHNHIICVGTIVEKRGERLKIHFDGWPKKYDFWTKVGCKRVHCPGWCEDMEIPLCPPKGKCNANHILNLNKQYIISNQKFQPIQCEFRTSFFV